MQVRGEGKAIPLEAWTGPSGFQEVEVPRISRQTAYEGGMFVRTYPCYFQV
jgi:hypothetical protein